MVTATDHFLPIHREAPAFVEQATEQQILVTGIKVLASILIFLGSIFLHSIQMLPAFTNDSSATAFS